MFVSRYFGRDLLYTSGGILAKILWGNWANVSLTNHDIVVPNPSISDGVFGDVIGQGDHIKF